MKTVSEARQSGFKWACIYDDVPVMAWVKKPGYDSFEWKDTELDVVCIIGAGEYVPENIIDLMAANAASKGNDMFADNITDMQIGASEYVPDNLIDIMADNASKQGYDFVMGVTDSQIKNFEKSVKDLADFIFNVK